MPTPGFLHQLNDEQREAVLHEGGPLSVLAGPGSGKTRVIIHRIARLVAPIDDGGVGAAPEDVLALAFTIKSANEMRTRLAEMIGVGQAERVRLSTCHAFGRRVVKRFGDRLGYPYETQIADSAQRARMLRDLIAEHALFEDRAGEGRASLARHADTQIRRFRTEGLSPERVTSHVRERLELLSGDTHGLDAIALDAERATLRELEQLARLYTRFEDACRARGWLTLEEYLTLPLRLLDEHDDARAILRNESRHIVVDEFQDWSPVQIGLLKRLAPNSERHPPDVCVVGDDDQAIYAFRGADDRAFDRFEQCYPEHRRLALIRNYRSAGPILEVANRIMQGAAPGDRFAPDKRLIACADIADAPGQVNGLIVDDDKHSGVAVAAAIRQERSRRSEMSFSRFAVVARTNTEAERIADELEAAGIPTHVRRNPAPWDDAGVQDLFAWLRILAGRHDSADEKRVLLRPPVGAHHEALQQWEKQWRQARIAGETRDWLPWLVETHSSADAIRRFITLRAELAPRIELLPASEALWETALRLALPDADGLDASERAARIAALVAAARFARSRQARLAPPGDLRAFLEYVGDLDDKERSALSSPGEERVEQNPDEDLPADAVACLTAHQAKGLEFDTVFVPRVRPGWGYPLSQGRSDDEPLPEGLTGRAQPTVQAEERRVFYVACTRAKRRLVLLAKSKKSRDGRSIDYFLELTDGAPPLVDESVSVNELIESSGLALPTPAAELDGGNEGFFASEVRRLRRQAGESLVGVPAVGFDAGRARSAAAALEGVAERLRALADLRDEGSIKIRTKTHDEYRQRHEIWKRREASLFRPWPAPLRLSYSVMFDWQSCPRCCCLKHLHRLQEPSQPHMLIGNAIHASLEQFVKESQACEGEGRAPPTLERLLSLGRERARALAVSEPGARDLQHQTEALLRHAHALHSSVPGALSVHIEAVAEAAYRLDGESHTLVAKLDRVDQLPNNRFRVVDYKTGSPSKAKLEPKPNDLQFGVYALVLPALLDPQGPDREIDGERAEDPTPFEGDAEYWLLETGQRGLIDLAAIRQDKIRAEINKTIRAMRAGEHVKGDKCKGLCAIAPQ